MAISSTPSVTETALSNASTTSILPAQTLDQQDFLKLLVTQLSMQDPMNPKKDTDFIAQMAQFSSLEQTKSMQADMAQLCNQQQLLQANALIGRQVELQTGAQTKVTGTVSAIHIESGTPKIVVNGKAYDLTALSSVASTDTAKAKLLGTRSVLASPGRTPFPTTPASAASSSNLLSLDSILNLK
jgi:flagellar basal-body rod modification protein FlgD